MTNELEKKFFDTFGIVPKSLFICKRGYYPELCTQPTCKGCNEAIEHGKYPQISDRILLELICIDNQENLYKYRHLAENVEELKTYILEEFIFLYEIGLFKRADQVRTLFEEG